MCQTAAMARSHRRLARMGALFTAGLLLSACASSDTESEPSAGATGTSESGASSLLPSVTNVTADVDGNSIRASWERPTDDQGAVEYRAFALDEESIPAYQCTSTAQECTMTDVSEGTYTVIVRAAYGDGLGPVSEASAPVVVE